LVKIFYKIKKIKGKKVKNKR